MKTVEWIIAFVIICLWCVVLFEKKEEKVVTVTKVVNAPATDEQLLDFWFGNGDKTALRKRICK